MTITAPTYLAHVKRSEPSGTYVATIPELQIQFTYDGEAPEYVVHAALTDHVTDVVIEICKTSLQKGIAPALQIPDESQELPENSERDLHFFISVHPFVWDRVVLVDLCYRRGLSAANLDTVQSGASDIIYQYIHVKNTAVSKPIKQIIDIIKALPIQTLHDPAFYPTPPGVQYPHYTPVQSIVTGTVHDIKSIVATWLEQATDWLEKSHLVDPNRYVPAVSSGDNAIAHIKRILDYYVSTPGGQLKTTIDQHYILTETTLLVSVHPAVNICVFLTLTGHWVFQLLIRDDVADTKPAFVQQHIDVMEILTQIAERQRVGVRSHTHTHKK
jgi:hypothetical protein